MKTILITAYEVTPAGEHEAGAAWRLICLAAKENRVIIVTGKESKEKISRFMEANPASDSLFIHMELLAFDLPHWSAAWREWPLLKAFGIYSWQLGVAYWLKRKKLSFDITHSLNGHNNWSPSFLWIFGKPFIWGPVSYDQLFSDKIIKKQRGRKARLKNRVLRAKKWCWWNLNPFLHFSRKKTITVFSLPAGTVHKLKLRDTDKIITPEKPASIYYPLYTENIINITDRCITNEEYQRIFRHEIKAEIMNRLYNDCISGDEKEILLPHIRYINKPGKKTGCAALLAAIRLYQKN
jgi:hypothetical protein